MPFFCAKIQTKISSNSIFEKKNAPVCNVRLGYVSSDLSRKRESESLRNILTHQFKLFKPLKVNP